MHHIFKINNNFLQLHIKSKKKYVRTTGNSKSIKQKRYNNNSAEVIVQNFSQLNVLFKPNIFSYVQKTLLKQPLRFSSSVSDIRPKEVNPKEIKTEHKLAIRNFLL